MTAVKDAEAEYLRQRVRPMRSFAGAARIHAFRRGLLQIAARTTGPFVSSGASTARA